ncbi:Putative PAS domain-containing protein [Septoria linicola]|uniref:PAS domain-containing protein n=1 Tax=Septoria linicola TaxID=215465 RepID=A0A9Q9EKB6_9PEZI|nr:Putative PAS domain-containing protein [Septoria linicola]
MDYARATSPPASLQLSLREKRRSQRMSLRSPVSFTTGSTTNSYQVLLPLQLPENTQVQEADLMSTDDPRSWSIMSPTDRVLASGHYSLEARAELLFGQDHLRVILGDPKLLFAFSGFLSTYRPWRRSLLDYYWDAIKALRAMNYARAIVDDLSERQLPCIDSAATPPVAAVDARLSAAASEVFDDILREDLPAYITQLYTRIVVASVQRRITGALSIHLREASHGLAEVFVLTDPSRHDNPIILASEEFALTTQYGLKYVIGRNCRFLQGPFTSKHSVRRLAMASAEGKEHTELLVNYRRDGTPFLNLLMIAPLLDSKGKLRYYLGAQVDVSGLLKDNTSLASLHKLATSEDKPEDSCRPERSDRLIAMKDLSTMLGGDEVDIVRRHGGYLNQGYSHLHDTAPAGIALTERSRILLQDDEDLEQDEDSGPEIKQDAKTSPRQKTTHWQPESVYKNYLVLRPGSSLRILFASAPLRLPGMLQSHFLHRIGGSSKMRHDLEKSLQQGSAVTARVHWLSVPNRYGDGVGRPRWCHCTPLLHHSGAVGLWVVIIVDDEEDVTSSSTSPSRNTESRHGGSGTRRMGLVEPGVLEMERVKAIHKDFNRRPSTAL